MPRTAVRTYLFADLRDYTAFVEAQGDAAATRLIRGFRRIVRDAIAMRGGAEIKTEGDSFYVVFERPGDAVRAAVTIQEAARKTADSGRQLPIRTGIGINTGEAIRHESGYVGAAVIVASRLASQAPAGGILISDTVRGLIRTSGIAPMTELGAWNLKGIAEPVRVYSIEILATTHAIAPVLRLPSLLLPARSEGAPLATCPDLIGREDVMASLQRELAAAARGDARFVALVGEAGIGKSRVAREIASQAHRDGFHVFAGRAHAHGALPYEAFIAALRPYARIRGIEVLKRLLGSLLPDLAPVLPELDLPDASSSLSGEERRDRFFRVVQLVLEDAAAQRPVLLVIEDIHDSDAGSREIVAYLSSMLRAGVCVVFTCRNEEIASDRGLRALFVELERDRRLRRLPITPLTEGDVHTIAKTMLGTAATDELATAVHERANGVAFYVEELLKSAVDSAGAALAGILLPHSISDSVQLRLDRLAAKQGTQAVDLLRAAALAGVPLARDVVGRLTHAPEAETDAALAACVEAHLLERTASRREIYQFRHALAREAVEGTIPPAARRALHLRIAAALEASGGADTAPALLARHLAAAGARDAAMRYAIQAVDVALRMGAYRAAIEQLELAEDLVSSPTERHMVLERLAAALLAVGEARDAEAVVRRAESTAPATDVVGRARLAVLKSRSFRMQGRRVDAEEAARHAVDSLEVVGGEVLAEALVMSSELAWVRNDLDRAGELARRALDLARAAASDPLSIGALTALGAALLRRAPIEAALHLQRALDLATAAGRPAEAANCWYELSRVRLLQGDFSTAAEAAMSGLQVAREHGLELVQCRLLAQLTTIHVNHGDYGEARTTAEQAVALARAETLAGDAARVALGHVLTNQGDEARALEIFDQLADRAQLWDLDRRVTFLAYRTQALLSADRLDEAASAAAEAVSTTTSVPGMGMTAFLNAAAVAEARRDALTAASLSQEFERYFKDRDTALIRAVRLEIAAIRELCEGRDASADYRKAAEAYERIGGAVHALYRRATAATLTLADRRLGVAARAELTKIRSDLERRGAFRYARLIDRALARRSRRRARLPLTAREMQVALLLAGGATDGRVASELGVSLADVERLIKRVLRSLGVTTRSQVATWAIDRGAAPANSR